MTESSKKRGKGREREKQKYVYQLASSGWFWDQGSVPSVLFNNSVTQQWSVCVKQKRQTVKLKNLLL